MVMTKKIYKVKKKYQTRELMSQNFPQQSEQQSEQRDIVFVHRQHNNPKKRGDEILPHTPSRGFFEAA